MRFVLNASPSAGLHVLPSIPEGDLLQIEGRNGIGKTLAVRLLQLATGTQPFLERAHSWSTLKDNLNDVVIIVDGLKGGHELRFELMPDGWPTAPEVPGPWLGSAFLDGNRIEWADVSSVLQVHRIGGDETLGESLAAQVAGDAESVRQLEARQEEARAAWSARLGELRLVTEVPAAFDIPRLRRALDLAQQQAHDEEQAVSDSREALDGIDRLRELLLRRDALKSDAPGLRKRIQQLESDEAALRAQLEGLDAKAAAILARDKQSEQSITEVDRLVGLHRKRQTRLDRRRRELVEVCKRAEVTTPVDLDAALELLSGLNNQREQLLLRRQAVDRAGLMLELIDAIEIPVDRGLASRLGEEAVAQVPAGLISVQALATGLNTRRETLEGIDRTEGDRLLVEIQRVDARIDAARELPHAVRLLSVAESDLATTAQDIADLLAGFASDVADDYDEVSQERVRLFDALTQLVEERAQAELDLGALLADGDLEAVTHAISDAGNAIHLPEDQWDIGTVDERLQTLHRLHEEALSSRQQALERRNQANQELSRATAAVRGASSILKDDSQFQWLHDAELILPDPNGDPDVQVSQLAYLAGAVDALEDLMLHTLNDQQELGQALANLEQRLRASSAVGVLQPGPGRDISRAVERHYEASFAEELSTEMVSDALFGGGRDVAINLNEMTTSWTLPSGQRNTRPLEAFSSGERAFAYTRVQVERHINDHATNRAIFLDEFGSFVAHDRFEQLKRYLRSQALGRAADKIVVILPLRRTPEGPERAAIDRNGGYVTQELS